MIANDQNIEILLLDESDGVLKIFTGIDFSVGTADLLENFIDFRIMVEDKDKCLPHRSSSY